MKIGIIGGGFMGEAFIKGMLDSKKFNSNDIIVIEINKKRLDVLKNYKVQISKTIKDIKNAEIIILAVKPQNLNKVLQDMSFYSNKNSLLISIVAGIKIAEIIHASSHKKISRVMPNLPASIGYGTSAYITSTDIEPKDEKKIQNILDAFSKVVIKVKDEDSLDAATAIHGSGPAYMFLILEYIIESAKKIGINEHDAFDLATSTMIGAAKYASISNSNLQELREAVTSPGGTTEAALKILNDGRLKKIIEDAIFQAYNRAIDLGK